MAPKKAPPKHKKDKDKDDSKASEHDAKEASETESAVPDIHRNLAHVTFTPARPKDIISPHSGSILADEDPIAPFTDALREKALKLFHASATKSDNVVILEKSALPDVWSKFGYCYERETILSVIQGWSHFPSLESPNVLTEIEFLSFMKKFHAPASNFGQRLRLYCSRGIISKVTELVIRGCNMNAADGFGLTPLHYAAEFNKPDVIDELHRLSSSSSSPSGVEAGTGTGAGMGVGTSPLQLKVNGQDKTGWTALHSAAHHGSEEALHRLLDIGADASVTNVQGKTALHVAASQGRTELCLALLQHGATMSPQEKHGMTVLHEAAFRGHEEAYNALLTASTDPPSVVDSAVVDKFGNQAATYLTSAEEKFSPLQTKGTSGTMKMSK